MLLLEKISNRIKKHITGLELGKFTRNTDYFINKVGVEIGGPSGIFSDGQIMPVYKIAQRVDGVNFSTQTVWENNIQAGNTYNYEVDKVGIQYIMEASDLATIADEQYDFLLSSHSLEHCANPLKALYEWQRVVCKGGGILVVVPDKRVTFDRRRNVTSFEHLLQDYKENIGEDDKTHLNEILELHDLTRDPGIKNADYFLKRSLENYQNRCLHHHVFDISLLKQIFTHLGLKIVYIDSFLPSLIIFGEKQ